MRIDAGTLRPPVRTEQGFLRVDGLVARPGIFEYINTKQDEADGLGKAGHIRYELRTREEALRLDSLAQYEGAPITIFHPKQMVDSKNVRALEVGSVTGPGRIDGDRVGVTMMIKDSKAVARVDSGELVELSPGYKCELVFTKGFAPEFATRTNPRGYYDFIQENIRVNHLALVDRARGGSDLRIRLDRAEVGMSCSVERGDCGCASSCGCAPHDELEEMVEKALGIGQVFTDSVDGHQHLLEGTSGRTTYSVSAGSDIGHDHAFVRNADGSYLILDNAGHSHVVALAIPPVVLDLPVLEDVERVDDEERYDGDWDEGAHPRADDGKFGEGGGSSSGSKSDGKGGGKGKGGKEPKAPKISKDEAHKIAREVEDKHQATIAKFKGDTSLAAEKEIHASTLAKLAAQKEAHTAAGARHEAKQLSYAEEDAHATHAVNASKIANASGSAEDHKYAAEANAKASAMSPKGSGRNTGHAARAKEHEEKAKAASGGGDKDPASAFLDADKAHAANIRESQAARAAFDKARDAGEDTTPHREALDKIGAKADASQRAVWAAKDRLAEHNARPQTAADTAKDYGGDKLRAGLHAEEKASGFKLPPVKGDTSKDIDEDKAVLNRSSAKRTSTKRKDELDVVRADRAAGTTDFAGASQRGLDGIGPQVRPVAAGMRQGATTMDHEEQIRSLKAQLAESEKLAEQRQAALTASVERGDRAEATVLTLEQSNRELETRLAAGAEAGETAAIREQAERADRAEAVVRQNEERFDSAVRDRVSIVRRALVVMGDEFNPDRMSNREVQSVVVKRLDSAADISSKVTDAYIAGRFDSLCDLHSKTARSLTRAGSSISGTRLDRAEAAPDARVQRATDWRNQWKRPLPSSRNAKKEA